MQKNPRQNKGKCTCGGERAKRSNRETATSILTDGSAGGSQPKIWFSAQQTLDCIQSMYEAKYLTYPRTDSRYLGTDMVDEIQKKIGLLSSFSKEKKHTDGHRNIK